MTFTATRLALLGAAALLPLAACATTEKVATTATSAIQAQTTPTLSTTDATFLNTVGTAGAEEVKFGQLAQSRAASPAIRRFATTMVTQHTDANARLMSLAQIKQMTPSSTPDTMHDQAYTTLQAAHGHAFDKMYMDGQVTDHQAVVAAFNDEIQNGTDPQIKEFATQNVGMIQQHLAMAKRLDPRR